MSEFENMETKTINRGDRLAKYVSALDYGEIIHYQDIERIVGEQRRSARYYNSICKAKKLLVDHGKAIKSIGGGDYQVLYPADYSTEYIREVRVAKNHIKRGGKILKGAPVNDMTTDERMTFNNVSDFHARMQASISGSYVEVKRLGEHKHPLLQNNA